MELLSCMNVNLKIHENMILTGINLTLEKGKMHLVIGENGVGKSSLVKLLSGIYSSSQYTGTILYKNKLYHPNSPIEALNNGIITLHQHTCFYETLSVADNFISGIDHFPMPKKLHLHSEKSKIQFTNQFLKNYGLSIDSSKSMNHYNYATQRIIELIRLYLINPTLLILDEPLAALNSNYCMQFIKLIKHFKENGTTILCACHEYTSFLELVDYVSVLRKGCLVATLPKTEFLNQDIPDLLWGQLQKKRYPKVKIDIGKEVLCAEHISTSSIINDVSFILNKREILGIWGPVGSGKSSLARTLFGLKNLESGKIYVDRIPAKIESAKDAIDLGIAYITDERIEDGLFNDLSVLDNIFSLHSDYTHFLGARSKAERSIFQNYTSRLNLNISSEKCPSCLSGSEQQKVLLLRWLISSKTKIYLFDEPTQSIDISSKVDLYNLFNDMLLKGASIIIFSSNIEELAGICDRILILNHGTITGEIINEDEKKITSLLPI